MRSRIQEEASRTALRVIHLGGGTPSILDPASLNALLTNIKNSYCDSGAEPEIITIETTPYELDIKKFNELKDAGLNRISIGVQTFNDKALATFNRSNSLLEFENNLNGMRELGFDNINFDLLYGYPGQTFQDLKNDLDQLIDLSPDHVEINEWRSFQGILLGNTTKQRFDETQLQNNFDSFRLIQERLTDNGYRNYSTQLYCKPGKENISHLMGFSYRLPFVAFGGGAWQYYHRRTTTDIEKYINMDNESNFYHPLIINEGTLAWKFIDFLWAQLSLSEGIRLSYFNRRMNADLMDLIVKSGSADFIKKELEKKSIKSKDEFRKISKKYVTLNRLNKWLSNGNLEDTGSHIRVTKKGQADIEVYHTCLH